jgi:hypothetical protein
METEMREGKPLKQSLAIAYAMKRKAQRMAGGGMACPDCASGHCMKHGNKMAEGGDVQFEGDEGSDRMTEDEDDMVSRIMSRRMSEGGRVANETEELADFSPNEFDDLVLDDDLESSYTGANSGDEIGNAQEDEDRRDIVSRIMRSRKLKDRNPRPA